MGLSRTVSEINGYFSRKSQIFENRKFSHPVYFVGPLKGFPWNWVSAHEVKKTRVMVLPDREKKFEDIFIRLDTIQYTPT